MSNKKIEDIVIIGSGPAGLTAAIYAARANLKPLVIDGNNPGGQLMQTSYVDNWPGNQHILGPELMNTIRKQAESFGTRFVQQTVVSSNFTQKPFIVTLDNQSTISAHSIIIATGSSPKRLNCPGENEYWGKGVTTCAVCDGAFYVDKEVLVVGGGDTAMEDAMFLTKFTNNITVIQISEKLSASHAMQQPVLNNKYINIIYNSSVTKIKGDGKRATHAQITNNKKGDTITLPFDGMFIAIGMKPNSSAFVDQVKCDKWGYLVVHDNVKTSIEGVFAAGDIFDYRYKQAITSAGSGCMAALDAERYMRSLSK
jgi:thioredoxin reductase (NADPH)